MAGEVTPANPDSGTIDLSSPEAFRKTMGPVATNEPVSGFESLWRGAAEGATFGFDDKLGIDKDRREQSRKENPWTHFAGEMIGGIAPVVATGGVGAGIRGASVAARGAGLVPTSVARAGIGTANAIESAMLPGQISGIGTAALQGGKLGAVYGGLSGAGHADVDSEDSYGEAAIKRAKDAAKGAVIGGALGVPLGVAGNAIGRAAQHQLGARAAANAETADATAGSLMAISRGLERDRISPDDIIAQITREFPDTTATAGGNRFWGASNNRQPWTAPMVEDVVRRSINGETAAKISAALRANGTGPGAGSVRTLLNELEQRHLGPLNLVDRASMVRTGSGDNTQMTMRAAAATPGQARSVAREELLERQIGSRDRLLNALERHVGSTDFDGVVARHEAQLDAAMNAAYTTARATEQPFNLNPIINRWTQDYPPTRRGPIPEAVHSAIDAFVEHRPLPGGGGIQRVPPQNLQQFIDARQNLLAEAMRLSPGVPRHRIIAMNDDRMTPASRRIMAMRGELSAEVRRTNPNWGVANDLTRDGLASTEAAEAGARQAMRLNGKSRDNLRDFTEAVDMVRRGQAAGDQAMIAAGQARADLFRVGLVRKIHDDLANEGQTHNLTRTLRSPSARHIVEEVLGPDDARRLYAVIDAEHAMNRTYASQFGSQTTPLREAIDDLNRAPRTRSAWENLNPKVLLANATEYVASRINADRNQRMMPLMTQTNPIEQLGLMRSVGQVAQARQIGDQVIRRPAVSSAAPIGSVATAELLPKPKSDQVKAEGRYLSQARNALARKASRAEVEQRLRSLGVDPRKL